MDGEKKFTIWRGLRLSSFHIGSAMGDILITSIWNRILIVSFGIPAAPVSLLIALRYLLAPLSFWAGNLTDNRQFFGLSRTPIIWLGRVLMLLSLPLMGLSVVRLGGSTADVLGWTFALLSSVTYGVGTLISGSPFLALVREVSPPRLQGVAISMVQTALIIFFAIVGIAFSIWMPNFDDQTFWQMIVATMLIGGFFWFFSIFHMEPKGQPAVAIGPEPRDEQSLGTVWRNIWSDRRTRLFFVFLSIGQFASWAHEAILEPFGADAFDLSMGTTTRFNSYWQMATVITLVMSGFLLRKQPPESQKRSTSIGLWVMAIGQIMLTLAAVGHQRSLIEVALLIFGAGFGIYTFGSLSLMAVMSPDRHSGAYLGLWSISILVSKGLGTLTAGVLRDVFLLQMGLPAGLSYGIIFLIQMVGLAAAALLLSHIDIFGFARDTGRTADHLTAQIAAAD